MPRIFLVLLLLALVRPASAAERPAADDMGKLLAYTVNCTCVVGEKNWILGVYRQLFTDAYGEAYANALQTPLQGALKDGWDRHMDLCERICELPVTRELQLALARADGGPVDASGVRAVLGPPPANETGTLYGVAESGEAVTDPPKSAPAEVTTTFAPQPNYCVFRNYAKGCSPPEEEERIVLAAPPPAAMEEAPAQAVQAAVPVAPEAEEETAVAPTVPPEPAIAADDPGDDQPPDYFEAAGTGDNWSSALCRTSPSKPECRKAGGS